VMFLDEPTAGLDPRGRNEVWTAVRGLAGGGATVLLTTQYLEEADRLADAIALIDHGRVVAEGSPDELKARFGGDWIEVVVADPETLADAAAIVAASAAGEPELDPDRRRVSAPVRDRIAALGDVMRGLAGAEIAAEDVAVRRPTLDEVFLEVVS
jgi:ABC-2 type transport system ATP-binding protein